MHFSHGRGAAAAVLALCLACALSGCEAVNERVSSLLGQTSASVGEAQAERAASRTQVVDDSELLQAGTLTVGLLSSQSVPLLIEGSGTFEGVDVSVAYALADQLGISSVAFVEFESVETAQQSVDLVIGVEGATGNYAQESSALFARDGSGIVDATDLAGATIGLQTGSLAQHTLLGYDLSFNQASYATLNDAFAALEAGEVDFVACDAYAGAYLAASYADIGFVGSVGDVTTLGVSVTGSEALASSVQAAMDTIQTNGVLLAVRARWVGDLPTIGEGTQVSGLVVPEVVETVAE